MKQRIAQQLTMRMEAGLQCVVCRQIYKPSVNQVAAIEQAIFGFEPGVVCIGCGFTVSKDNRTSDYYVRWVERLQFFYQQTLEKAKKK
jgi:hypothetical protein